MRRGFRRLQATWRARKLTLQFRLMRQRVTGFQRFCRGYIARKRFRRRIGSIIKLQSHFRRLIAKKQVLLKRIENRKKKEAERIRKLEEAELKKKMKASDAKKEAERLHQVCAVHLYIVY